LGLKPSLPQSPEGVETTTFLLATFAELYRHELGAEEDVHRTLPFFGTALGIVVGSLAYAAGRLPKLPDAVTYNSQFAFWLASGLLALAVAEASLVLLFLSRAIARREYLRVGPEAALRARLAELQAYYDETGVIGDQKDREIAGQLRETLVESYTNVTAFNRYLNQRRYEFRSLASSHLVRSLIWAFGATTVIFAADKLGYFPKVML